MPILGTVASQFAGKPFGSFESIATATVSTATPTISFTSIPATYTHLQLRGIARDARTVNVNNINIRENRNEITRVAITP